MQRARIRPLELLLAIGASAVVLAVLLARPPGWETVAIVLATPFSFAANKLWAFAEDTAPGEGRPAPAFARRRER